MEDIPAAGPDMTATVKRDRWLFRLVITVLLNFIAGPLLTPYFQRDAAAPLLTEICAVPAIWGTYCFLSYHTQAERKVGYAAFVLAVVWFAAGLDVFTSYKWGEHLWQ